MQVDQNEREVVTEGSESVFVGVVEPGREYFNIVDISIGRVEAAGMIASSAEREEEKNTSIVSTCMASAWGGGATTGFARICEKEMG